MGNEITVQKKNGIALIKYLGIIDSETYTELRGAIENLVDEGLFKIVVDLAGTTYISSAGWGSIIGNMKKAEAGGGSIVIAAMTEDVKSVYTLAEFSEIIKSFPTVRDGMDSFVK